MRESYKSYSDEELIGRLRDGEKEIEDYLMEKYKNLVRKKAGSMFILGGDTEDLIQEGMIGLFKAVRDYDFGRDASFYTFAELCISRQMYTAVQASGRKKHMPLNSYISLYTSVGEDVEEQNAQESILAAKQSERQQNNDPESKVIDKENVDYIENVIETQLSSLERQVIELYLTGMNYSEIAKVLSKDEKVTDNALFRAKQKIKKALHHNI